MTDVRDVQRCASEWMKICEQERCKSKENFTDEREETISTPAAGGGDLQAIAGGRGGQFKHSIVN